MEDDRNGHVGKGGEDLVEQALAGASVKLSISHPVLQSRSCANCDMHEVEDWTASEDLMGHECDTTSLTTLPRHDVSNGAMPYQMEWRPKSLLQGG